MASRRLREMLALTATVVGREVRPARRAVRVVARALGPIRELDVAELVWHETDPPGRWVPIVVTRLDRRAADDRRRLIPGMRRVIDRVRSGRLDDGLALVIAALGPPRVEAPLVAGLAGRVRRRARDLVRTLEAAGTVYAVEPLHDVRIATKKLRYAVELVRDLTDLPVSRVLRRLKQQQDLLGRLHDLQVVQERLQAVAAGANVSRAIRHACDAADATLELDCRALHGRFVRGVPRLVELCEQVRTQVAPRLVPPRGRRMTAGRTATSVAAAAGGEA